MAIGTGLSTRRGGVTAPVPVRDRTVARMTPSSCQPGAGSRLTWAAT